MKLDLKTYSCNAKYFVLGLIGTCLTSLGIVMYAANPLQTLVDKLTTLTPGTFLYRLWTEPPYDVTAKIYIFNVTNSDAFLDGREKLKLKEVGPYIYADILKNTESHLNENGTLTFKPRRQLILRRDLLEHDPDKEYIMSPNIPLLGISTFLKEEYGLFVNMGFSSVVSMLKSPPMKNITASEYLFGYSDDLVSMASTYLPSWIDFDKFGIIDRLMALDDGNNTVTIHLKNSVGLKENEERPLLYSINRFNGSPGLHQWGYKDTLVNETSPSNNECNTVEGNFDAGIFPRNLKENTTLGLYRRAFCRTVQMEYENTDNSGPFKLYNYRIDQNFLGSSEQFEKNKCYCLRKGKCLPKGFGDISPCYYGIPITMSQPHCLNADPAVTANIEGLNPDKEKHDTVMKVNPDFGVPLAAQLRIQVNLRVAENNFVAAVQPFKNMMIPLFWIELAIVGLPIKEQIILYCAVNAATIEIVLAILLILLGISMMATSVLLKLMCSSHHRLEDPFGAIGYSPILIIPVQQHVRQEMPRIS